MTSAKEKINKFIYFLKNDIKEDFSNTEITINTSIIMIYIMCIDQIINHTIGL